MNIKQIRNATISLNYAGTTFLIDPFLAEKGTYPPVQNTLNQDKRIPTVELPIAVEEIIQADAVIVTHLHPDHFDSVAKEVLPKHIKVFAQSEEDAEVIRREGFENVDALSATTHFQGICLYKTNGQHGTGKMKELMGAVSGVVFQHPDEKTLYVAGDTIWCEDVKNAIDTHQPNVIIVNGGAAQFLQGDPITMTKEDINRTYTESDDATVIVSHMEAVNHCLLTRKELRDFISEKDLSTSILVPDDGEMVSL
ncbi:MBL fold metallo-hydrolase [Pseudalkalibacillus decolorationis]|uniref:MBL fold metallo-hydrolase n=1 Tax=Pseudalkalibacillus decolorationis TaxID=163879 RepID=UPI0021490779|nr:MBL fold metallo-hydrolase [Pseudalkalibacillus decolorationis]